MAAFLTHITFREPSIQDIDHTTTRQCSGAAEQDQIHQHGPWVVKVAKHPGGRDVWSPCGNRMEIAA